MNQIRVWSNGGMIQTGENVSTRRKPVSLPPYTTHLIRIGFGLNPGLCGKKWKIFGKEFMEKNKNI
jgi:hypothetical protein